jgi:hypothetical protein
MTVADHDALTETTRTVMDRYVRDLYDARDLGMVSELLADPMYRHDAGGKVTVMTNDDCRARIGGFFDAATLSFRTVHLVVEGQVASWTYEMTVTANDGTVTMISSIETFLIEDGKITHAWNAEHTPGPWA